jgi:hypothetical protein
MQDALGALVGAELPRLADRARRSRWPMAQLSAHAEPSLCYDLCRVLVGTGWSVLVKTCGPRGIDSFARQHCTLFQIAVLDVTLGPTLLFS